MHPLVADMQVSHTAVPLAPLRRLISLAEPWPRQPHLHLHDRRSWRIGSMTKLEDWKAHSVTYEPLELEKKPRVKNKPRDMPEMIGTIRAALKSISDGEINVSAYDTAWVALVKNIDGGDGPQFPLCIDWIVRNQLADGSWGDKEYFQVQDRIINTLACIIALKSWNIQHEKCRKGMLFIRENLRRLMEVDEESMLIGFEITFPALLEIAKNLSLNLPYDEPALQMIYAKREQKLTKITKDLLHIAPTTLLLSIEGMQNLDWERLLKFQSSDGSFMSSPAPTAYALMQTGDKTCFQFLDEIVHKFNGGVPFTYPVDIFERLWAVDRLERLGISRYFRSEIMEFLDYAYRHWTQEGLPATRDCLLNDIDDTAMGFRLLRLHGYHVSPGVFKHFERDGEFVCYHGQSNQSVTATYNLYRAAQVAFPDEDELQRANSYSRAFLQERRASKKLNDKWVVAKDLPGEVGYALDFPWKASLPRIETRMYLQQYGGSDDVWIGKVLYRMPLISNDMFLEAAKADFNNFQRRCRLEWHGLKKWFDKTDLELSGMTSEKTLLRDYFLAAASIFEPNRAAERLAWARTSVVAEAVSWYLQCNGCNDSTKERLIHKLENHGHNELGRGQGDREEESLLCALREVINHAVDDKASNHLSEAWKRWLRSWTAESHESCEGSTALLLVRTLEICSGRHRLTGKNSNLSEYCHLELLTSSICSKLAYRVLDQRGVSYKEENSDCEVDLEMQELTQCILQSNSINKVTKHTFISVVKTFYYVAHSSPETIDSHISKVIFEDVI